MSTDSNNGTKWIRIAFALLIIATLVVVIWQLSTHEWNKDSDEEDSLFDFNRGVWCVYDARNGGGKRQCCRTYPYPDGETTCVYTDEEFYGLEP